MKEQTRGTNILDIFLLNQHSLVHSTTHIPPLGMVDYDIVQHELKINLGRRQQKQRHIKLYKKTDWNRFRKEMDEYQANFREKTSSSDTNTKWSEFKKTLNKMT